MEALMETPPIAREYQILRGFLHKITKILEEFTVESGRPEAESWSGDQR